MLLHEAELSLAANLLVATVQSCWLSMTAVISFFRIKRRIPHYIFEMSPIGLDSMKYIYSFSVKWQQWIMSCKYCPNWNTIALFQQKKRKKDKQKKVKYGVWIRQYFKVWRLLFMPHINYAQSVFFEPSITKHLKNVQDNPYVVKRPKSFVCIYSL